MRLAAVATVLVVLAGCTSERPATTGVAATGTTGIADLPDDQRPDFGPGAERDPATNSVPVLECEPGELESSMGALWGADTPPRPELATPESALRAYFNSPDAPPLADGRQVPEEIGGRTKPEQGFWISSEPREDARSVGYAEGGKYREHYRVSKSGQNWYVEGVLACAATEPTRRSP